MKGVLEIDGFDIYEMYGVIACYGCIEAILNAPTRRKPYVVNWNNKSGITVDLSKPMYNSRNITLPMAIKDDATGVKFDAFKAILSTKKRFTLSSLPIGMACTVHFQNMENVEIDEFYTTFSVELIEQFPYNDTISGTYTRDMKICEVIIDGINLGEYGISVNNINGLYDTLKNNPLAFIKYEDVNGSVSLPSPYSYKATPVGIKMQMQAPNLKELKLRYITFVKKLLMSPGKRVLSSYTSKFKPVNFYHTNANISNLFVSGDGSCVVDINLNITVYEYYNPV